MSISSARASETPCLTILRASLSGSKAMLTMFLYPQKPPVSTIQDDQMIQGHSTDGCERCNPLRYSRVYPPLADRCASQYDTDSRTAAVAKGDEAAFERLYAATRAKLFGVVLRILRRQDLAEEVIQEAYVRIWNSAGQFNPGTASPITWMVSIARNRAIDVVRKRTEASIEEEPTAMEVAADSPDPLARREMTEELKRLLECIGRLEPERQKLGLRSEE